MAKNGFDSALLCLVCDADGLVRYESPASASSRPAAPQTGADDDAVPPPDADDGWSSGAATAGRATAAAAARRSLVGTPIAKAFWFDHDDCDVREIQQTLRRCARDRKGDRVRAWLRVDDEQLTRFEVTFTPLAAPEDERPLILVRAEPTPAAAGRRAPGSAPESKPLRPAAAAPALSDLLDARLPTPMLRLDRAHGTILAANSALADLVGRDRAACANLPLTELVDARDRRAIAEFLAALRADRAAANDRAAEVRLADADGRDVQARLIVVPDPAAGAGGDERVLLVVRDVSSESQVAQLMARADQLAAVALRNSEALRALERAVDRAPVGLAILAPDGAVVRANPQYESIARDDADVARAIDAAAARARRDRGAAASEDVAAARVRSYWAGDERDALVGALVWPRDANEATRADERLRAIAHAGDDGARVALAWAERDAAGNVRYAPLDEGDRPLAELLDARSMRALATAAGGDAAPQRSIAVALADGRPAQATLAAVAGEAGRFAVAVSLARPTPEQAEQLRDDLAAGREAIDALRAQSAAHAAAAQALRAELDAIDREVAVRDARLAAERGAHLDALRVVSGAGTFAWDATDGSIVADARARALLGCGDGPLNQGTLLAAAKLEDRQAYERALFDALNAEGRDEIDLVVRIGREARPVRIVGRVLFDDAVDRDPTRLVAGVLDLSEAAARNRRIDALDAERDALAARVAALEADVARATADLVARAAALATAEATAASEARERAAAAEEVAALRDLVAARDVAAATAKLEHARLVADADKLRATIAKRNAEAATLARDAATLRSTLGRREEDVAKLASEADALKAAVEDRERRAAAAERDAARAGESLDEMRKALADREARAVAAEQSLARLEAEADAARVALAERSTDRDAIAASAAALDAELKAAHQRAANADRAREALDAKLAAIAGESTALSERAAAMGAERDALAGERDALAARVATLEPDLRAAGSERAALSAKLAKAEKDRGKVDEKLKKSEAERATASDALAKAESRLRAAAAAQAEAEKRAAKLERERAAQEEAARRAEAAHAAAAAALAKAESERSENAAKLDETSLAHAARVAELDAALAATLARAAEAERARDEAAARAAASAEEAANLKAAALAAADERAAMEAAAERQRDRIATLERERAELATQAKTLERDRAALEANIRTLHRDRATIEADAARQGRLAESAAAELGAAKARATAAEADRDALVARIAALESSLADATAARAATQDQLDAAAQDRDAARHSLRLRTAELNAILELAPDAIRIRADGVTRHNAAATALFGDAVALGFDDAAADRLRVLSVDDAPVNGHAPALPAAAALEGESRSATLGLRRDDDDAPRFVLSAAAPVRIDGRVVGAVVVDADQTEVRRLESLLARREQELNAVFQNTGVGVAYLDADGRVIDANPQTSVLLGFAHADLTRRPLADIAATDADRATLAGQIEAVLSGELASCSAEFQLARRDDRANWVQLTIARGAADAGGAEGAFALVALIQDIDELHRLRDEADAAAQTIAAARSRARLIAASASEAIALLDANGQIVEANDAARRLLAADDAAARFIVPETGEAITAAAFWPRVARGGTPTDYRVERSGADTASARVARVAGARAAGTDGVADADARLTVVRAQDVTELAGVQEALRRAQGEIVEAHTQMRERTLALEGNFVSAMQHLAAAAGSAASPAREMASHARLAPEARDAARRVADAIRVHERIVSHFKAAATTRTSSGASTVAAGGIVRAPADVHAVIESAVELVEERFRAGRRLRRQLDATRATCDVDAAIARHGLWSILAHAASQAPRMRGGASIRTSVTPDGDRLELAVAWPTPRRNTPEVMIARAMIEAAGGTFDVGDGAAENESRTTLTFPLAAEHEQSSGAAASAGDVAAADADANGAAATAVLLVEDHESTARVLSRQLARLGCEVRHVRMLAEARDAIGGADARRAGAAGRIDLIVCDLTMPGGDPVELLADAARRGLPAIALRGYDADAGTGAALREAGIVEQLVKPVDLNALAASIRRLSR